MLSPDTIPAPIAIPLFLALCATWAVMEWRAHQ